ncbi:MAG TPA: rhamnulokinase family protein [Pyrinomonadaceae bacterium]|nr:rhamnulokinase family protein [Pyrinomonadaceae bacterium]
MTGPLYIAVDLGASSGRVFLVGFDPGKLFLEEIHRFQYPPHKSQGHLRWDFVHIFAQIKFGLRQAATRAKELDRSVSSLGIDSWAVDYGLLDADGKLIADPVCYRDKRTRGIMTSVFSRVPRETIFERTGIQFLEFNTLFQLYSEPAQTENAAKMLLLPDLINFFLTGRIAAEYTNATTTQLVNAGSRDWDLELVEDLGLPSHLLPQIVPAGTDLGLIQRELAEELALADTRVIAPATHDTGSAVAATPLANNWAYISSGTWSLIGVERNDVLVNSDVARLNFTNEGGAFGTIRFLKNVMGLWIFEACRREWTKEGLDVSYDEILKGVVAMPDFAAFIFPDDESFLNPPGMLDAITKQLHDTGQEFDKAPIAISKIIFDSLAFRYASVLRSIELLTETTLEGIQIVGGGGQNVYLDQMTANASGLKVQAGLVEATVLGNALVQAIAGNTFDSLSTARNYIQENVTLDEYLPQRSPELVLAAKKYGEIEERFVGNKIFA